MPVLFQVQAVEQWTKAKLLLVKCLFWSWENELVTLQTVCGGGKCWGEGKAEQG